EPRRQAVAVERLHRLLLRLPAGVGPQLEMRALPDQPDLLVQPRPLTQRRRDHGAASAIERFTLGVTDEQTLEGGGTGIETRHGGDLTADRLPGVLRVDEKTAMGVRSDDQRR